MYVVRLEFVVITHTANMVSDTSKASVYQGLTSETNTIRS